MRHTWHCYYVLGLVVKVVCGGFGIALLTPYLRVKCANPCEQTRIACLS